MIILGINAYHGDASAAIFVDGELVAAVEEERFTRVKHQAGFPKNATRWCLQAAGVELSDLDHVGISRDPFKNLHHKLWRVVVDRPPIGRLRERAGNQAKVLGLKEALATTFGVNPRAVRAKTHRVEHHRAHLASAFFCSPFEDALCVSLDGMGDFASGMWASGAGNSMSVHDRVLFPHSLGVFYTAFTQFLGLPRYGDEYKLMGLSAYGEPKFLQELRNILALRPGSPQYRLNLDYFIHHHQGVNSTWAAGQPEIKRLWSDKMAESFGAPRPFRGEISERDRNLAASIQRRLEEVELEMLRRLHRHFPNDRLVMAGGVALNCVVNGMVRKETPFQDIWIQPAAHDAGTALGAALYVQHEVLDLPRSWEMTHGYWGPAPESEQACELAIKEAGYIPERLDDTELLPRVARLIAEGNVVGWYQGRSEFGPRALGNRSIVCDPRNPNMKDILNARIKLREPFRPFAPSILASETENWFEQSYPSPHMLMTYKVLPEKRSQVPAVTHEDGTGRLQTVTPETNRRYHALITEFFSQTGVPVLLNTSLNENEPIVSSPAEAVACFDRTQMDALVVGPYLVTA